MKTAIRSLHARRIWDSRGRPTIEAEVVLDGGAVGRGVAPAGASRGTHEAVDLRDGGKAFGGFDVRRAIAAVDDAIAPALVGQDAADQQGYDARILALDSSPTKEALDWGCIVSARSGETEDVIITHLSTGWDAGRLKVGSFARSERMAKWNEALRIEDDPRFGGGYAGAEALRVDWRAGPWATAG